MRIMGLTGMSHFRPRKISIFRPAVNSSPLSPMKRFQKDVRLPQLPEDPRGALRSFLDRQRNFHFHRGKIYEKMHNTRAAISAYERAKYYKPSDVSLVKQVQDLRIDRLQNLKV